MVIELTLRIPYNEGDLELMNMNETFYERIDLVNDTSVLGVKRVAPFSRSLVWIEEHSDGVHGDVCIKLKFDPDTKESDTVAITYQLLYYFGTDDYCSFITDQLRRLNVMPNVSMQKGRPYFQLVQGE